MKSSIMFGLSYSPGLLEGKHLLTPLITRATVDDSSSLGRPAQI